MRQNQRFNQTVQPSNLLPKRSSSASGDGGILLAATELFAARDRHPPEDKRIFLELARNLLPSTATVDRRRIASLLAPHPEVPDDLLETLARDEDDLTAYPAFRYSPRLSVDLLLRTAVAGPDTLRKAIANRPSLRESIISALCEHAGADVIRILLDRDDIILSATQQSKLSCRSDIVATLGLVLAGQNALNPDGQMGQYLHLPAPLKAKAIAAAEMTSLVKQAQVPGGAVERTSSAAGRKLQEGLLREALAQNRSGFAELLGQGLSLPEATCDLLLQASQGDGLTIALKALGFQPGTATTILIRLFGEQMSLADLRNLMRMYRTLSAGAAEVLVGQWMLQDQETATSRPRHTPQYQERSARQEPSVRWQEKSQEPDTGTARRA